MNNFIGPIISIFCIGACYLIGSFPSGYIAGKRFAGIDLRKVGSGSTGATNVLRHVGKGPALIVFIIDVGKGALAVLLARSLALGEELQVAAGLASLVGHIWPIWLNWKGGKAVATGLGMLLGLSWPVGLASLGIFLTTFALSRIVSLSSISAAVCLPLLILMSFKGSAVNPTFFLVGFFAMVLILWRHRSNIQRLIKGTEPKVGQSE